MPTVLRSGPYRFFFYSHEPNEPPHVHVSRDTAMAKVWLHDLTVAQNSGFPAHQLRVIVQLVGEHRSEFIEAWNGFFGSD